MKNTILFVLVFFLFSLITSAQNIHGTVKGKLFDSTSKTALTGATISIVRANDSTVVSYATSDEKGAFEIKNIPLGSYYLMISHTGYDAIRKPFAFTKTKVLVNMRVINLHPHYQKMEAIVIREKTPILVKGDTVSYNTTAFKTAPNATVEDLIKKLPGMTVSRDGTVKNKGEQVQKVYVDGKEFFSNDPKLATQNLTADMVEQVQVFDDMSEQAKFNKIDDAGRMKSINLKLKKEKKKGVFGKLHAGYGTAERYDAGGSLNIFKGATQTSFIAKANNTNNTGFNFSEMLGIFGGGSALSRSNGIPGINLMQMGSFGGVNNGSGTGLTESRQGGINYRDTWSRLIDINGSYFYNDHSNLDQRKSLRQTYAGDSVFVNEQQGNSIGGSESHRFNMNLILSFDSLSSIIYNPGVQRMSGNSRVDDSIFYFSRVKDSLQNINQSQSANRETGVTTNWSHNLIWRQKFSRPGRTITLGLTQAESENEREQHSRLFAKGIDRDIYSNTIAGGKTYGGTFSYTEPLSANKLLEFNYSYQKNNNELNRSSYRFDSATMKYNLRDDSLSNHFIYLNEHHRAGTNFRVANKKFSCQLGFAVQQTLLQNNNVSKNHIVQQKLINYFPAAGFNFMANRTRNLRLSYRGNTKQPTATQLQEVLDISRQPYLYIGNPSLKQEFTNQVNLSYNSFNVKKYRSFFFVVSFSNTYDKISHSIQLDPNGTQLAKPVNLDGGYLLNANLNMGFPVRRMEGGSINFNTRMLLSQDPSLFNGAIKYTNNFSAGEELRMNFIWAKFDMGLTASVDYNTVQYEGGSFHNTLNAGEEIYLSHNYGADLTFMPGAGFTFHSDIEYCFNNGRMEAFNRDYAMWNAFIAKELFRKGQGELKVSAFDILDQNVGISRIVGPNFIEDTEGSVLKRYFMVSFSYRISKMGR